jgi:hypothetical protein
LLDSYVKQIPRQGLGGGFFWRLYVGVGPVQDHSVLNRQVIYEPATLQADAGPFKRRTSCKNTTNITFWLKRTSCKNTTNITFWLKVLQFSKKLITCFFVPAVNPAAASMFVFREYDPQLIFVDLEKLRVVCVHYDRRHLLIDSRIY